MRNLPLAGPPRPIHALGETSIWGQRTERWRIRDLRERLASDIRAADGISYPGQ